MREEFVTEEGMEEECPMLVVGDWIIETYEGRLWGIDAYSFETKQDAINEALGEIYVHKEVKQLTNSNVRHYQQVLEEQLNSDTDLI